MAGTTGAGCSAGAKARGSQDRARPAGRRLRALLALPIAIATIVLALGASAYGSPAGAGLAGAKPDAGTLPHITKQPANAAVEEGKPASFTIAGTGTPEPTPQWYRSTDGGKTWTAIEGATSLTYTIPATSFSENGYEFRATFTNVNGTATSEAATLTVEVKPVVTLQPESKFVLEGQQTTLESKASGNPAPTVQWQRSTNEGATWQNLSGATSDKLTISGLKDSESGTKYRAVFTNAVGSATSEAATLTVGTAPTVSKQPLNATVLEGETATFEATATGFPTPTEQWELSTNGGTTWAPIEGATSTTLSVPSTTLSEEGWKYRAVFNNAVGSVTSNVATLFVHTIPSVTLQPSPVLVAVGAEATFESTGTGNPAPTEQWERSTDHGATWTAISGATSSKLTISPTLSSENGNLIRATFKSVAGTTHSTAVRLTVSATDYTGYGWGSNKKGEVGDDSNENDVPTPAPVSGLSFLTAVSAGTRHSLALRADGKVFAWGSNGFGQLGVEGAINVKAPIEVATLPTATAVSAGGMHSLVLLESGTVMAFGNDEFGQIGNGSLAETVESPVAVQGLSGVVAIAAGEDHSLALLSNGTVMAWGDNEHGQLGIGSNRNSDVPVAVPGLTGVKAIAAGGQFSLALLEDGKVMAWGYDARNQLGNATVVKESAEESESQSPVEVEGLSGVKAIAAGRDHALALLSGGTVEAWGDDSEGEVGNGARTTSVAVATGVSGLAGVKQISAGNEESAALLESGAVMTWGSNSSGNLGLGTVGEGSDVPVQVTGVNEIVGIDAGGTHMLAIGEASPQVTAISPQDGPQAGGGTVHITGLNFGGATAVHFGAASATSYTIESPTSIAATAPAGTGTVEVTVTSIAGTSAHVPADRYSYKAAPTVTKLSVKTGPAGGGTPVTITGTEFNGVTAVSFGGVQASEFTVVSATSITAIAPANVGGTRYVTVTAVGGTSATSSKGKFKYVPSVESVSPANGPLAGGTSVVITGTGFAPGVGTTAFKFGKAKVTTVECESETKCTVLAPAQKAAGSVDVVATVEKAKSAANPGDRYTYE